MTQLVECLRTGENIYKYKNCVNIPPLAFVDDLLSIIQCGVKSIVCNSFINKKVELKNLEFGIDNEKSVAKKCRQVHVGKQNDFCPNLKAHEYLIPKVNNVIHLGDVISSNGKMTETIKQRKTKPKPKYLK